MFNFTFELKKELRINRTTVKLKHELISMEKHVERLEFDREIERSDIFTNIRKLRQQTKHIEQKLRGGLSSEDFADQSAQIMNNFEQLKEQQIKIFEEMAKDENTIASELEQFHAKVKHYENLTKNKQNQQIPFSTVNTQGFQPVQKLRQVEEFPEQEEEQEEDEHLRYENDFDSAENDFDSSISDSPSDSDKNTAPTKKQPSSEQKESKNLERESESE